ncbi:MAG TPA: cupin domain-containing protein [Bryobacteraceae bacterium]|nr:cupin domain-containing protein [Bryobacteraceae bacterium]
MIAARRDFYERISHLHAAPLWEVLSEIVGAQPNSAAVPALWRYDELRPFLMESGELITAREAERRVLMLENPGYPGGSRIAQSVYAGVQLVLPGESTNSHRHVASALRFILEGDGAYTAVDGVRATMHPLDLILTPSWTYHDHGNPGSSPVVWLDGLDIPIVNFFDSSFAERVPDDAAPPSATRTPSCFAFPYTPARESLRSKPLDPCHGAKVEYLAPDGSPVTRTLGAFLQFMPENFSGAPYRSTDSTVYCVAEGRGSSLIADRMFEWSERDIFVVPSWSSVSHHAAEDSVLFSFSDRPAQRALGIWREEITPEAAPRPR